jgi:hypothetical protein
MKSNGQHQKEAITTDQANRPVGDRETEREKQKLERKDADPRQQALEKHPKDSEQQ